MSGVERVGDLEVGQDLKHLEREWRLERIGWVVVALILLASAVGLLGQGGLSKARFGQEDSALWVDYYRIYHYSTPGELRVFVGREAYQDGQVQLSINRSFLENADLTSISPEPESVTAGADQMTYTFKVDDTSPQADFVFRHQLTRAGTIPVIVEVQNGPRISFKTLVLP